jgi:maltose-binding protein MalE
MKIPPILAVFFIVAAMACGCISQETTLPQEEQRMVQAYADPITDNLLEGFNQDNYTRYSRDFSTDMRQALNETIFEQNRALILSKIGLFVSRGNATVTQSGDYLVANYMADFEYEQGVNVRVVFKKGDDSHQVYGLWFNSPKLRS